VKASPAGLLRSTPNAWRCSAKATCGRRWCRLPDA